jgi:hypothetical protein
MSDAPVSVSLEVKLIALLLIAGGLLGVGLGLGAYTEIIRQSALRSPLNVAFSGLYIALFICCIWAGVGLWRGRPQGYKWAKVLFGAQIPTITVPGFTYAFQTLGVTIRLLLGQAGPRINLRLGSSISIYVSPAIQDLVVGINVVAVFALIYLVRVTSPSYAGSKDKFGLI